MPPSMYLYTHVEITSSAVAYRPLVSPLFLHHGFESLGP